MLIEEPLPPVVLPLHDGSAVPPSHPFRVLSKLPFRFQTHKDGKTAQSCGVGTEKSNADSTVAAAVVRKQSSQTNVSSGDSSERISQQLAERTHILECAYKKKARDIDGNGTPPEGEDDDDDRSAFPHERQRMAEKRLQAEREAADTLSRTSKHAMLDANQNVRERSPNQIEKTSTWMRYSVYFSWLVIMIFAYFREFLRRRGWEENKAAAEDPRMLDFVPLYSDFESIYARNCYVRVRDVFERPICGVPGATVRLKDRVTNDYGWTFQFTGTETDAINVGSYNYLGFAESTGPCAAASAASIDKLGLATCLPVHQCGRNSVQKELEKTVAQFLGVEDAICFSMGFATNSMNAPCLVDKHSLIVSDQYNHASLILGCRLSGASIKVFKHNDMSSLEKILRQAIIYGNTRTRRPFRKILIVVEGIYSMEGSVCNLPEIIALKKKYGAYLYLDEAHSVGAMGPSGRGVVEYWGCSPRDVDIMMGTFTKSFGSAGGYIAGKAAVIAHLRKNSPTGFYAAPMAPPVAQQVLSSMRIIMGVEGGLDGQQRIERLARNARYFRLRLKQMGFIVYGTDDSPVVPMLIYYATKCGFYGRQMLKRGVAIVVVSFPATDMTESRVRFCVSAAHTKEQLDKVLEACDELGTLSNTKYSRLARKYRDMHIEW